VIIFICLFEIGGSGGLKLETSNLQDGPLVIGLLQFHHKLLI